MLLMDNQDSQLLQMLPFILLSFHIKAKWHSDENMKSLGCFSFPPRPHCNPLNVLIYEKRRKGKQTVQLCTPCRGSPLQVFFFSVI